MFTITKQSNVPKSAVELAISIPAEEVTKERSAALKHIGEHAEVAGFRKGHVPESVLVSKVGEQAVLEEAAELAIQNNYPDILLEAKVHPVAHPKIIITKIAADNPLELTMTIDVMPEVKLPDYKSIAKKVNSKKEIVEVTDKELEQVLEEVKKYHTKEGEESKELTDDLVKTLGDFKDLEDFKTKMKENLQKEKEMQAAQKKRMEILTSIREKTDFEIPATFTERELDQMMSEFTHELSRIGQTLENYLKHTKKSEEDIRGEWDTKAESRVAHELILQKIADEEKVALKPEDVEHEVKHMVEHYPDAPKERITSFVEDMMRKQEVFKLLESQN